MNLGDALKALGERVLGTRHLEEAVAAWDQCLMLLEPARPPERVEGVRSRRDSAQAEITRRQSKCLTDAIGQSAA